MDHLPATVAELLDLLDSIVRRPDVRPGVTMDALQFQAGQRDIVDQLLFLRDNPDHGKE